MSNSNNNSVNNNNNINKEEIMNKDFVDMTASDMVDYIEVSWDDFSAEESWDNTCDAVVDAVTNTSLSDIGSSIESGWDTMCSWLASDED